MTRGCTVRELDRRAFLEARLQALVVEPLPIAQLSFSVDRWHDKGLVAPRQVLDMADCDTLEARDAVLDGESEDWSWHMHLCRSRPRRREVRTRPAASTWRLRARR